MLSAFPNYGPDIFKPIISTIKDFCNCRSVFKDISASFLKDMCAWFSISG